MSVVGVDFGFQNTAIAAAGRGGVDVLLNGNSNRLNPCMVGFDQARSMGEAAQTSATSNYKNTVTGHMKRLIGLAFDDPRAKAEMELCSFKCVPFKRASGGPDGVGVEVMLGGESKVLPVESVAGMMVRHLGLIAAQKAAETSNVDGDSEKELFPKDWVVAVPAYMTDAQRRNFLVGCEISGVTGVQRLMNEHTAVALSYGIFKDLKKEFEQPTNVMFIDMGATCYTVSVVTFETGKLVVKSCYYDEFGGRDFDEMIAQHIATKFEEKYKGKLSAKPMEKPKVRIKLLAAAEKAKKTLSPQGVKETRVSLECLMDDFDFAARIGADEYEAMAKPYLDRIAKPIEMALAEAKMTSADLASVEIVGGSTRIGFIKKKLLSVLGVKTLSTTMNADEAVARGTALQSAILSPRFKVLPYEIVEAQPFPITVSWDEGNTDSVEVEVGAEGAAASSVVMFDRGSSFPVVRRVTLRREGEFKVDVTYSSTAANFGLTASSPEICSFKIKSAPGEEKKVRVNVKQDIHGIINLSSAQMVEEVEDEEPAPIETKEGEAPQEGEKKKKMKKTNLEFSTTRPLDWTQSEIDRAFETEVSMANVDRVVRETSDMRNELESYIYDMRDKIHSESFLGPYGTDEEKSAFSSILESTENWLYEDGFDATKSVYSEKLVELKKYGGPIEFRQAEGTARPQAVSGLQHYIDFYKTFANDTADEKYAHVTDEERQKVHAKCDEVSAWLYEMLDKQGSVPNNQNPVVTSAEIQAKSRELAEVCSPIKNKPKPKPAPVPAPADAKPDAPASEPMEMDETPATPNGETAATDKMEVD